MKYNSGSFTNPPNYYLKFSYITNYTVGTQVVPLLTSTSAAMKLLTPHFTRKLNVAPIDSRDKAILSTFQACAHKVLS